MSQEKNESKHEQKATKANELTAEQQGLLNDLLFCATTQESVNAVMTGEDWRKKARGEILADNGLRVDYPMAMLDEAAEFWASTVNFKWWAKTDFEYDHQNAVVELVDMLHFGLSQDLVDRSAEQVAKSAFTGIQRLADEGDDVEPGQLDPRSPMKEFIHGLTAPTPRVNWFAFWGMARAINVKPEVLVIKYRAKAALNKFRTQMGAAQGTYHKKWLDGKEDNFYLMSWLDFELAAGKMVTDEQIAAWLSSSYAAFGAKSSL